MVGHVPCFFSGHVILWSICLENWKKYKQNKFSYFRDLKTVSLFAFIDN